MAVDVSSVQAASSLGGHSNHADDVWGSFSYAGVAYDGRGSRAGFLPGSCDSQTPTDPGPGWIFWMVVIASLVTLAMGLILLAAPLVNRRSRRNRA